MGRYGPACRVSPRPPHGLRARLPPPAGSAVTGAGWRWGLGPSARRADRFDVARGHPELESWPVDVTDALVHRVLVAGADPGLDRGAGEVAGVGQLGGQARGDDVEVVDLAVGPHGGEQRAGADRAVGGKWGGDRRGQAGEGVPLVA